MLNVGEELEAESVIVSFNQKRGRITIDGVGPELMEQIIKNLNHRKHCAIQAFPDGVIISKTGVYWNSVGDERPIGYG